MGILLVGLVLFWVETTTEELVKNLGNEKYAVRENATNKLKKMVDFNLYLELAKVTSDSAEVMQGIRGIRRHYESMIDFKAYLKLKEDHRARAVVRSYESRMRYQYHIDLYGHHRYPWIWVSHWEYIAYLEKARSVAGWGRSPDWIDFHLATAMWTEDKITASFRMCMNIAESEEELRCLMACKMQKIQKEINGMIKRDYGLTKK